MFSPSSLISATGPSSCATVKAEKLEKSGTPFLRGEIVQATGTNTLMMVRALVKIEVASGSSTT